ncbi:MAG TPA: choice-of-anchor tandem repeat GloVer-containing protein [Terriglobales bacterium]|nr:choice-of-anchor tandem repeat GloVer-containing protein [Terriglobales bacterium]
MKQKLLHLLLLLLYSGFALGQAQYKVLYNFGTNPNDALNISGTLATDRNGDLFGTSQVGGIVPNCIGGGCGTVFEVSPNPDGTWAETIPYDFCPESGCADGMFPETGVVVDSAGNLYGVTPYGGLLSTICYESLDFQAGCGVVFELSPPRVPGGAWTYSLLYSFCSQVSNNVCQDGAVPMGLTIDKSGNLYGTTGAGGSTNYGTVFELSSGAGGWTEAVLYNFCPGGGPDCPGGAGPGVGVTLDQSGNLYGTTNTYSEQLYGATVYKLSHGNAGWTENVIYTFPKVQSQQRTYTIIGPVTIDSEHDLYTTFILNYSPNFYIGNGGLAEMTDRGLTRVFTFDGSNGKDPIGPLLVNEKRRLLYGVTSGVPGFGEGGNVYEINTLDQETVLYDFCEPGNCEDGYYSTGGVIEGTSGNLYGDTSLGGSFNNGVVFELIP